MAKETVPNRRYTDEFKLEALRLAESVGINQAAKRLGMPSSSLGKKLRFPSSIVHPDRVALTGPLADLA